MSQPSVPIIRSSQERVKSTISNSPQVDQASHKTDIHNVPDKGSIDSCEYLFSGETLADLKDMATDNLRLAGLFKAANDVEDCGHTYQVYQCEDCGHRPARIFHCDHRLCPRCHYRQLLRFFRAHKSQWAGIDPITTTAISYGTWLTEDIELALEEANTIHKKLFEGFWRANGGVYHREARLSENGSGYEIIYHYMLDCHPNTLLFLGLRLHGYGLIMGYKSFGSYEAAYRYFIKEHCRYPTAIVLREDLVRSYLTGLRHRRLIQGFGSLYRVSGGRGHSKAEKVEYRCPFCGGKCVPYFKCGPERVAWHREYRTFYNP